MGASTCRSLAEWCMCRISKRTGKPIFLIRVIFVLISPICMLGPVLYLVLSIALPTEADPTASPEQSTRSWSVERLGRSKGLQRLVRIVLGISLLVQCVWWCEGVLGIGVVFANAGATLDMVGERSTLDCVVVGFILLFLLSAHLFVRSFGNIQALKHWSIITFSAALIIGVALVYYPASNVYDASISGPGDLYTLMYENSGFVEFPVMRFAGLAPQVGLFNFVFIIPLFLFRQTTGKFSPIAISTITPKETIE